MKSISKGSAEVCSLGEYLSVKGRTLVIPPWQREYVWQVGDSGEVGELLEDLKEFVEDSSSEYWLGSVILCEEPIGSKQFWLIDGQQRTLTLLIFFMAAKRFLINRKLLDGSNERHARLLSLCSDATSNMPTGYSARVMMDRGKADDILQSIFLWSGLPDGEKTQELLEDRANWTQTQRNLANVADWIYSERFAKKGGWIPETKFVDAIEKILNRVQIVEMHLGSVQEALTVFDRINNRGADLNSADLIKNRIFQFESDEAFADITEDWREMRRSLSQCSLTRLKDPTFLLRSMANIQLGNESAVVTKPLVKGRKITYNELTRFWTERLDPRKSAADDHLKVDSTWIVKKMKDYSFRLAELSNERGPGKGNRYKDLYFARYLKIVQHFPLLLATSKFQKDVLQVAVQQIHARTAFYFLSGERTQEFENLVPQWVFDLARLPDDADISAINSVYASYRITDKQFLELHQAVSSWSYRDSTDRRKIRAVLSQLSRVMDEVCGKEPKTSPESYFESYKKTSKYGWDIDHIEARRSDPKDSVFHSIGNLTLLHPIDNRSKGKAKTGTKTDNYESCPLFLTKTLVGVKANPDKRKIDTYLARCGAGQTFDVTNWSEKQIRNRTDFYFQLLRNHLEVQ